MCKATTKRKHNSSNHLFSIRCNQLQPGKSGFLSHQISTSHQSASNIFLSQQISISHSTVNWVNATNQVHGARAQAGEKMETPGT